MLLAFVLAGASMLVSPGGRDVTNGMEVMTLLTAQEMRHAMLADEPGAWLVTRWRGEPRVRKPPLMAWLFLAAWADLDREAGAQTLAVRARLVAGLLGVLTVWATWSIGRTLDGPDLALLAALIAGTTFILSRQARLATFDIGLTAFSACGVALAGRALGRRGLRWWLGWGACALAATAALYAKNALALVLVGVPALALIVLVGERTHRWRDLGGLGVALGVAVAVGAAWYAAVLSRFPEQAEALRHEMLQPRGGDAQAPWYYLGLIALVAPWCTWLVAGLLHPFNPALRRNDAAPRLRRARLVPWMWLVAVVVLLSIPAAKQQRYVVPVIPAVGLLCAAVFIDHARAARAGRPDRAIRPVAAVHWFVVALAGVGLALALGRPAWLGADAAAVLDELAWWVAVPLGVALVALALVAGRRHREWDARGTVIAGATWSSLAWSALWIAYGATPADRAPARAAAASVRAAHPDARFALVGVFRGAEGSDAFRFYLDRPLPSIAPNEIDAVAGRDPGIVIFCEQGRAGAESALERAGRHPRVTFTLGGTAYAAWAAN